MLVKNLDFFDKTASDLKLKRIHSNDQNNIRQVFFLINRPDIRILCLAKSSEKKKKKSVTCVFKILIYVVFLGNSAETHELQTFQNTHQRDFII